MKKYNYFTLIELIIVIAVLGILASIVIPNISNFQEKAKVAQTVSNTRNIQTAVDMYYIENGNYPTSIQPTEGAKQPIDYELLNVDYLREQPSDEYVYIVDFYGTVSILDGPEYDDIGGSPNAPVQLHPPKITANVDLENDKIFPTTLISFSYELPVIENCTIVEEKWVVDGEAQSTAPNKTFSKGKHEISLSLRYVPTNTLSRSVEEFWTDEVHFDFYVSDSGDIKQLVAGYGHSMALTEGGQVYSWGYNYSGQLGDGTKVSTTKPNLITSLPPIKHISTTNTHNIVVSQDGKVYTWGSNEYGQLGIGNTVTETKPVLVENLPKIKQVSAASSFCVALTEDGEVYAWGDNRYGQLGDGTYVSTTTPVKVGGLSNIKYIQASGYNSFALTEDGEVYSWGHNSYGQLGDGTTDKNNRPKLVSNLSNVSSISAGNNHVFAITQDGLIYAWGNNSYGQLGIGSTTYQTVPTLVTSLSNVKEISTGFNTTIAVTKDGKLYACGSNYKGYLGVGSDNSMEKEFMLIDGIHNVKTVVAAYEHAIALTDNQQLYSWGWNRDGQLGDGTKVDKTTPTLVLFKQ